MITKKTILLLLFCTIIVGCNKKTDENVYQSAKLYNYNIEKKDSLIFQNRDSLYIGEIAAVKLWRDKIILSDSKLLKCWVFSNRMEFIKTIGRKGKGPGEFAFAPVVITSKDNIYLLDGILKRIYKYDENFNLVEEGNFPKDYYPDLTCGIRINNRFIFSAVSEIKSSLYEYYKNSNSIISVNSNNYKIEKSFLKWDDIYLDKKYESYCAYSYRAKLTSSEETFFVLQNASTWVHQFDKELKEIKVFGTPPKYLRKPPEDYPFSKLQNSFEATVDFSLTKTTFYHQLYYDSEGKNLYLNYINRERDAFDNKTFFSGKQYLQIYNSNYDCIFDGEIPGLLCFAEKDNIYVLDKPTENQVKIYIYQLKKK